AASQRRFHVALRHLMAKGIKAPGGNTRAKQTQANRLKGAASQPAAELATAVIQPAPANLFTEALEKEKQEIEEAIANLRAERDVRGKVEPAPPPAPKPIPAVDDAFEEALATPAPAPMKGNR